MDVTGTTSLHRGGIESKVTPTVAPGKQPWEAEACV
jgi:hypothetical protein